MEDAVDVVHRVGRKMHNKNRRVMVLFIKRQVKKEVWRRSKDSSVCKDKGIPFSEVLLWEVWEERRKLGPQIEQVRRAGKSAFFQDPS